jgi:hypothetical protein
VCSAGVCEQPALGAQDAEPDAASQRQALSNGIDSKLVAAVARDVIISSDTTFDVDTGAITGGVTRAAGESDGSNNGIGYLQVAPSAPGEPLGVFVFHSLTIESNATVRFVGRRAVVLLIGDAATIAGTIDVSAGHDARSTPGPGGGAGGIADQPAQGCGAGGSGGRGTETGDGGGGGAGAGRFGAQGGDGLNNSDMVAARGGTAGQQCLPADLQPLLGGSGGGAGGPGAAMAPSRGGGGGGGLQISALGNLRVTGHINAGGAGGEGGPPDPLDGGDAGGGAGAGGGGGGGILLEAPMVTISDAAAVAANGGGGGGGASNSTAGQSGASAQVSLSPALGGAATIEYGVLGGNGGVAEVDATSGGTGTSNGGGGGGAVGVIVIRGTTRVLDGVVSPKPIELELLPRPAVATTAR